MIPIKYEGKGILVPVFFLASITIALLIYKYIEEYVRSLFGITLDYQYIVGFGLLIAGAWTNYAKDTYVVKDGKKVILEEVENSFYFIKMKYWVDIYYITGICVVVDQIFF